MFEYQTSTLEFEFSTAFLIFLKCLRNIDRQIQTFLNTNCYFPTLQVFFQFLEASQISNIRTNFKFSMSLYQFHSSISKLKFFWNAKVTIQRAMYSWVSEMVKYSVDKLVVSYGEAL